MRKLTQKEFIERSKNTHNNKYDYSKTTYIKSSKKVEIICKEHGTFWQTPAEHMKGSGCKKCGYRSLSENKTKTYASFLEKANTKHNNKYKYVENTYKGYSNKINILCSIHGEFSQLVNNHIKGQGCPKCGIKKQTEKQTISQEDYIKRFEEVHNNKFDYSKVEYVSSKTKVIIICKEHGEFEQTPYLHLKSKQGCPKCSGLEPVTKKEFVKKAIEKHDNRYDFSNLNYKGYNKTTEFICNEHGKFKTKPSTVLTNMGCNKCSSTRKRATEEIIEEFKKAHEDFYDYSLVKYKNNTTKVKIICPKHGEFKQRPKSHKKGEGCYYCGIENHAINGMGFYSKKRAEKHKNKWSKIKANLYYVKITTEEDSFYKIGITTQRIEDRFKYLKGHLDIIYSLESNLYEVCVKESTILRKYNKLQYIPKNKNKYHNTECFKKHLTGVENIIFL